MDYRYEQALEDARFFEKNINLCTLYRIRGCLSR